jgi:hypothetical protein
MIEKINPAKIIPIHTTKINQFEAMFEGKVVIPQYAQSVTI